MESLDRRFAYLRDDFRQSMNHCRYIVVCLALGWLPLALPCAGQDPAPAPTNGNGATSGETPNGTNVQPPAPEPISAANITSQSAEVDVQLQRIEANVQPSPTVAKLAIDFSKQAQTVAQLRSDLAALQVDSVTARQLEEQRREWNQLAEQLNRWLQRADERWKILQQTREELRSIRQRWALTRDAAPDEELPAELMQRVEQILARVESLEAENRPRIDELAEVIQRLTDARQTANDALKQLSDLNEQLNNRLLRQDSPPLWRTQQADWLRLDDTTRQAANKWRSHISAFVLDNWIGLLVQLLIFLGLTAAALGAQRAGRSWPEDQPELARARFLLSRPLALAMAFTILAGVFIYGTVPAAVRDVFYLLLLLPMLRLAAGLGSRTERVAFYGLLALSALYQIVPLSPEGSLLLRATLLLVDLAAVAIVGYVIWWGRAREGHALTWSRGASVTIFAVVWLLLVTALVSNVLGWVILAHFLSEGTLLTCQGALLAILFVRAAAGLLPAIVRQGPGRALLSARLHPQIYERAGVGLLGLLLLVQWSQATLRRFRLTTTVWDQVEAVLATPLSWAEMELTVGGVLKAIAILLGTFVVQRVLSFLLREELFPRLHMRTSSTAIFATLLKYVIVAAGLGMAGSALGFTGTQLTVLFGALGVGIGFGLQNIVSNFVSGLILLFEQPIKIGDIVELGGVWGTVRRIGVRATVVQTLEGSDIVVPNADLISKEVKNWTLSGAAARVEVLIGTAYGSDPREVLRIVLRVAREHEHVSAEPEPLAMLYGFGDSALNFRLLCWTTIDMRAVVISELHIGVYEALAEADIEIPFPQRDLHVRSASASADEFDRLTQAD